MQTVKTKIRRTRGASGDSDPIAEASPMPNRRRFFRLRGRRRRYRYAGPSSDEKNPRESLALPREALSMGCRRSGGESSCICSAARDPFTGTHASSLRDSPFSTGPGAGPHGDNEPISNRRSLYPSLYFLFIEFSTRFSLYILFLSNNVL
jgi:hypothetical protein